MQRWNADTKDHPQLIEKRQIIENDIIKWEKSTALNSYNIPVVFHILYENESENITCLLYTSPSPRDGLLSRMPSSA